MTEVIEETFIDDYSRPTDTERHHRQNSKFRDVLVKPEPSPLLGKNRSPKRTSLVLNLIKRSKQSPYVYVRRKESETKSCSKLTLKGQEIRQIS